MDFDSLILPECFIDTTLAETLSFPKRGYKHIKGCNKVLLEMNKKSNNAVLGIIDDDKCVPALFNSFELLIKQTKKITVKKDPNLKRLFSTLKQNESSDFYKLAQWIELFKANPYNLNVESL